jgi:hypothetical protein
LEALHPGALRRIIEKEVRRYWDPDHDDAIEERNRRFSEWLRDITAKATAPHQAEIDTLREQFDVLKAEFEKWREAANPIWQALTTSLAENQPDPEELEWTTDFTADEDPDPLFDSTRSYVEQIDRYKAHQGKRTCRKPYTKRGARKP